MLSTSKNNSQANVTLCTFECRVTFYLPLCLNDTCMFGSYVTLLFIIWFCHFKKAPLISSYLAEPCADLIRVGGHPYLHIVNTKQWCPWMCIMLFCELAKTTSEHVLDWTFFFQTEIFDKYKMKQLGGKCKSAIPLFWYFLSLKT